MDMNIRGVLALATISALTVAGCSTEKSAPPPPTVTSSTVSTEKGGARAQEVTLTEAIAIDVQPAPKKK